MGYEDPLNEDRFIALFQSVDRLAPPADFVRRTMRAVKREPLPAGRRRLRSRSVWLLGWATLVAGVAVSAFAIASQPLFAWLFTVCVTGGLKAGMWLMQSAGASARLFDVFTTTGLAVSRAVVTREGMTALLMVAAVATFSLSALRKLLISEWEGSRWQEVS